MALNRLFCCGFPRRRTGLGEGLLAEGLRRLDFARWECGMCRDTVLVRGRKVS